jgi:hypothetical protein
MVFEAMARNATKIKKMDGERGEKGRRALY